MKRLFLSLALILTTVAFAHAGEPMSVVQTTWFEATTGSNAGQNYNVWTNFWPGDGAIGGYVYAQAMNPSYSQVYGGIALRKGIIELGAGLGTEHVTGADWELRKSVYGIVAIDRLSSATWFEQSTAGGWWLLSQNMYAFVPQRFEAGYRLQRYLGGGPMVRGTATLGGLVLQPSASLLFDGDDLNPILGLSASYKF